MTRNKTPSYVFDSPWDCIEKKEAREITIVEIYRHFFGQYLPKDSQYWTMCGSHFDKDGFAVQGEFGFLLEQELIKPSQFYGVDREKSIIQTNKQLFPNTNWIYGDFLEVMEEFLGNHQFNPAVINYDGVMQPKFGTRYLRQILKLIDHNVESELLLVSNFVLKNPYLTSEKLSYTVQNTIEELSKVYWIPDHWNILPKAYVYSSESRKSNARMGVIIFIKAKHDIKQIKFTPNRRI